MTTGSHSDDRQTVADRLAKLHFTMQPVPAADRGEVKIAALDSFLRGLLFTDGTVSRALEVQTLSRVAVEEVDQVTTPVPAQAAQYLDVSEAAECLRRRVMMTIAGTGVVVWAESYIVPDRLPTDFLAVLHGMPHGIGGSLQQLKLESWRELLWFRLGIPPHWAPTATPPSVALTRLYRIITDGQPALLISEAFAVEMHSGLYRLMGLTDPTVQAANGFVSLSATAERQSVVMKRGWLKGRVAARAQRLIRGAR